MQEWETMFHPTNLSLLVSPQEDRIKTMHGQTALQICIGKWICVTQGNVGLRECTTQIYCRGHVGFIVQVSIPLDPPSCLEEAAMFYAGYSKAMTEHSKNSITDPFL